MWFVGHECDFLDVEGGEGVRYVGLICKKIRSYRLLDALGVVRVAERVFFLISVFCVKNGYILETHI